MAPFHVDQSLLQLYQLYENLGFFQVCPIRTLKLRYCKILKYPEKQLRHHGSSHFYGTQASTNR